MGSGCFKSFLEEKDDLKLEYQQLLKQKGLLKDSLISFDEYLKLFNSIPLIFENLNDINVLEQLLKIFFSNFTIETAEKGTF
jgi:hypothetical protein